jgi:hypothetical protein
MAVAARIARRRAKDEERSKSAFDGMSKNPLC